MRKVDNVQDKKKVRQVRLCLPACIFDEHSTHIICTPSHIQDWKKLKLIFQIIKRRNRKKITMHFVHLLEWNDKLLL